MRSHVGGSSGINDPSKLTPHWPMACGIKCAALLWLLFLSILCKFLFALVIFFQFTALLPVVSYSFAVATGYWGCFVVRLVVYWSPIVVWALSAVIVLVSVAVSLLVICMSLVTVVVGDGSVVKAVLVEIAIWSRF